MNESDFVNHLVMGILPFLPVLFGAVELLKKKFGIGGAKVEILSMVIFLIYGALVIVAFFYPSWGVYIAGGFIFLLMCALAPSGFYKFINERAPRI